MGSRTQNASNIAALNGMILCPKKKNAQSSVIMWTFDILLASNIAALNGVYFLTCVCVCGPLWDTVIIDLIALPSFSFTFLGIVEARYKNAEILLTQTLIYFFVYYLYL